MSPTNPYSPTTSTDPWTGPGAGQENTGGTQSQQSVKERVTDAASQAKQKASEYGQQAIEKIDSGRQSAAGSLANAANSLRRATQSTNSTISNVAQKTANTLENTATYMREHDVRGMMTDAEGAIKRNPGPALICAAAFGFLLGTAMRRDNRY
jgi:ElaB/YqjD/DUF883 family membrane-anchored ribosome-binding protein